MQYFLYGYMFINFLVEKMAFEFSAMDFAHGEVEYYNVYLVVDNFNL